MGQNPDGILEVLGVACQEPIAVGSGVSGSVVALGRWVLGRDVAFGLVASGLGEEPAPLDSLALEMISAVAALVQVLAVGKEVVPEEQPVVEKAASLRASAVASLAHDEKSELAGESGLEQAAHVVFDLVVQGASVPEMALGLQRGLVLELASGSGTGAGPGVEEHLDQVLDPLMASFATGLDFA